MTNPDDKPDIVAALKDSFLYNMRMRMEGTFDRTSDDDVQMFEDLFFELVREEIIALSRSEQLRLKAILLAEF